MCALGTEYEEEEALEELELSYFRISKKNPHVAHIEQNFNLSQKNVML